MSFPSAAEMAATYRATVAATKAEQERERLAEAARNAETDEGRAAREERVATFLRESEERIAAAKAVIAEEFAAALTEYLAHIRGLIQEAIEERVANVGYWDLNGAPLTELEVDMEDFRCEKKHCYGEEYDGTPAYLEWTSDGLNCFRACDLIVRQGSGREALFDAGGHKDVLTAITEELTALGYSVTGDGVETLCITFPLSA
jgi:hypothetical protein